MPVCGVAGQVVRSSHDVGQRPFFRLPIDDAAGRGDNALGLDAEEIA
jgi:hypothetical protein